MDPFHEGGSVEGVDLRAAGEAIMREMKRVNPEAVWVVQAWQACPHPEMIRHLRNGDMLVLDLFSESRPQWGDPESTWYRENGFDGHDWAFCMLLNYGGNVGLFGKLQHVVDEFYKARSSSFAPTMRGVGLTMEGIENNPVMYELVCELPWSTADGNHIVWRDWLSRYVQTRYGNVTNPKVSEAWLLLARSIYGCPADNVSQGCRESVFCARPSLDAKWVSSWAETVDYYEPDSVIRAAQLMVEAAADMPANANFRYDLVDITRQAVAERARLVYNEIVAAYKAHDRKMFRHTTQRFLRLLLQQDRLLSSVPDFMVGRWIKQARSLATTQAEADHYEWNARKSPFRATARQLSKAVCASMPTRSGAVCCATSTIRVGVCTSTRSTLRSTASRCRSSTSMPSTKHGLDATTRIRARRRATLWSSLARLWLSWTEPNEKKKW